MASEKCEGSYKCHFNTGNNFPVFEILAEISNILSKTFGPEGSTTILEDRNMQHKVTKDGYTVMKSLYSEDDLERVILEYVKRISMRLVRTVGDGSTSAVIVANSIAQGLKKFIESHKDEINPGDTNRIVASISNAIQTKIMSHSKEPSDKEFEDVCMISTNGDKDITRMIVEAYKTVGKFGIVQIQAGDKKDSDITYNKGFELYRGWIDPIFGNQKVGDKDFCELNNARILMVEGHLGGPDIAPISRIMEAVFSNNESLVIVANGFNPDFFDFIRQNMIKNKRSMPLCCIAHGTGTKKGRIHFSDAAVVFNAKAVQYLSRNENIERVFFKNGEIIPEMFTEYLGFAKKVVVEDLTSKFFEGEGIDKEDYNLLKIDIEKQLEYLGNSETKFDYDSDIGELKVRYGRLCSASAIITVGGGSIAEIQTTYFQAEDAALAAKWALQLGVVPAGNLFVPYLLLDDDIRQEVVAKVLSEVGGENIKFVEELIDSIILAYLETFKIASKKSIAEIKGGLENGLIYNIRTKKYESIDDGTSVLNPARTDKEIIMAAMSVISLIATSNQFIFVPKG